jgi:demethylmenaquinone methyltransferase/2-methoxy-6-polyprenyl-1,4-benzoquinol methylase
MPLSHNSAEAGHFGFRDVPLADKQGLVDGVFRSVASRYDLMNDLMSGGLHRAWKDALVTVLNPPRRAGQSGERRFAVLDLAGGTGDMAFRTLAAGGPATRATVADINPQMLAVGRARAAERGLGDAVSFVEANAEALPFPDRSFDAVMIAFGIRNVPPSGFATCRASRPRSPRRAGCSRSAGVFCVWNSRPSMCRGSTRFTISTLSTSFRRSGAS